MKPKSVAELEDLGRIRLSRSFFMRDFLYSEIAKHHGVPNVPENPDLAVEVGKRLCGELLEPLNATFGRIAIRSAYRSPTVNALGNEKGHNCASNDKNYGGIFGTIWIPRAAAAQRPASSCLGSRTATPMAPTGDHWRTGFTITFRTADCSSSRSSPHSTSVGMNDRHAAFTASANRPGTCCAMDPVATASLATTPIFLSSGGHETLMVAAPVDRLK
jgi:hypothetical protein